jgi:uncharacterized OB-fold protein
VNLLHPASVHVPSEPGEGPELGLGLGPALVGSRCDACGQVVFPKIPVCPACRRNGTMKDVRIGRTAKLFSHTIARSAPKGFKAPLFQAFVDLPEGPRIFTLIGAACPVEDGALQDGMEMRLVVEQLADTPENKDFTTYKYVPAARRNGARHA